MGYMLFFLIVSFAGAFLGAALPILLIIHNEKRKPKPSGVREPASWPSVSKKYPTGVWRSKEILAELGEQPETS